MIRCMKCHIVQTSDDHRPYQPMQIILGLPVGWWSADGEELCGPCCSDMFTSALKIGEQS